MENSFIQLFPNRELTKSQSTQIKIVRHAVACIAQRGIHNVNFTHIAKAAKVTRPLVKHYFGDLQELHLLAARSVWLRFQEFVVQQVEQASTPEKALKTYVEACLRWPQTYPNDAKFWGQFQSLSLIDPTFRKLHEEVTSIGKRRILELLLEIGLDKKRASHFAVGIQSMIMGAIWTMGLEEKANTRWLMDQINFVLART